ncbi:unnamed protein product [Sphagnum jensenii]|uniref:Uncharacterized protein n=1 Tax=Sphagnum jensenii TaxID=128206 RepID=A0ABP1BQG7_9BRYO
MCVDELSTVASICPFTGNQHDRTRNTRMFPEPYRTRMSRRRKCSKLGCRNHYRNRLLETTKRARKF